MKHLLSPLDLSVDETEDLLNLASRIAKDPEKFSHCCDGKKLATLFYEPSTRTRLSFEAAMINLGGSVLGFSSADSSSASKGESVSDTIRVISCYADICDLKFGRTVHSLIRSLIRYKNVKFILISPKELRVPDYIREDVLIHNNVEFEEVERLEDVIPQLDILYMTRVQKERFFSEDEYLRMKDFYILNKEKMAAAKDNMYVLHPLPRVNEISVEIDDDPRAAYFKQVQFGVYVRMALILTLLGLDKTV